MIAKKFILIKRISSNNCCIWDISIWKWVIINVDVITMSMNAKLIMRFTVISWDHFDFSKKYFSFQFWVFQFDFYISMFGTESSLIQRWIFDHHRFQLLLYDATIAVSLSLILISISFFSAVSSRSFNFAKTMKPYKCCECESLELSTFDELESHLAADHLNIFLFECERCSYAFATSYTLAMHYKIVHRQREYTVIVWFDYLNYFDVLQIRFDWSIEIDDTMNRLRELLKKSISCSFSHRSMMTAVQS